MEAEIAATHRTRAFLLLQASDKDKLINDDIDLRMMQYRDSGYSVIVTKHRPMEGAGGTADRQWDLVLIWQVATCYWSEIDV